jgi:8-oxo-dGTP diphosphatase
VGGGRPVGTLPEGAPKQVVLCFLFRTGVSCREVLLGLKKTGFGAGMVVAPGGKVEPGESASQAAVRELREETGIHIRESGLVELGRVEWRFPARPKADMAAVVFTAEHPGGTASPSAEMEPYWFPVDALPYERMWEDARHWLAHVLAGSRLDVLVTLNRDNLTVRSAEFR